MLDLSVRANLAFSPNLTLGLWMQPFVAVGAYSDTKELARPSSFDFVPFLLEYDPNFTSESLQANVVLRWEYAESSTLYVVWSQSRYDATQPGEFRAGRDLIDAFSGPATHVLMVKLSHRFDL